MYESDNIFKQARETSYLEVHGVVSIEFTYD